MNNSFQKKLLTLLVGLVVIPGLVILVAVLTTTRHQAMATAESRMQTGERVLLQLVSSRSGMLADSVNTLVSDFGFRRAVATGERETIDSMLLNHSARIRADLMLVLDLQGHVTSSTLASLADQEFPYPRLITRNAQGGQPNVVKLLDGKLYQLVIAPVLAPQQIGWVCIGFAIDGALAGELSSLSGVEVAFTATIGEDGLREIFVATDLAAAKAYLGNGERLSRDWLTRTASVGSDVDVLAVMQLPMDKMLAAYRQLQWQLAAIFGFSIFGSILVSIALSRRITRPLRFLMRAVGRIQSGDYSRGPLMDSKDEFHKLYETLGDMREGIREREARIIRQATHDRLTGLLNRDELMKRIDLFLPKLSDAAILCIRLTRFREINSTLGREYGDAVLRAIAKRLNQSASSHFVGRTGSGDFTLVRPSKTVEETAAFAVSVRDTLMVPIDIDGVKAETAPAIGVVLAPEHGNHSSELFRRAEIALGNAVANVQRIALYRNGQDEEQRRRLAIANDLRQAIAEDQLTVHYQPKVDMRTRTCSSVEALVRWTHPRLGRIRPDEFITIAENAGLIRPLTRWVLKAAIRQLADWKKEGLDLTVAINLSAMDLADDQIVETLEKLRKRFDVGANQITLEVTESAVIVDTEQARTVLSHLKSLGFTVAIDDFGTGQSSLAQLGSLPASQLKIDKSFVLARENDADAINLLRSIISLAHSLNLSVVAEGVETLSMWNTLFELDCDVAQGYLLSRPLKAELVADWVACNSPVLTADLERTGVYMDVG
ncbi:MAG: EAL domain-containing protein [Pseudomonadota bacterium]